MMHLVKKSKNVKCKMWMFLYRIWVLNGKCTSVSEKGLGLRAFKLSYSICSNHAYIYDAISCDGMQSVTYGIHLYINDVKVKPVNSYITNMCMATVCLPVRNYYRPTHYIVFN